MAEFTHWYAKMDYEKTYLPFKTNIFRCAYNCNYSFSFLIMMLMRNCTPFNLITRHVRSWRQHSLSSRSSGPSSYRIIDWFGLEATLKIIQFQSPCHEQGHLPLDQVAQSSIQPGLEHCQEGGSHSFSGQPVPVPHHPQGEEFLPYI